MRLFAVIKNITTPFIFRNLLTLLAALDASPSTPSLVSFVTAQQRTPRPHPPLAPLRALLRDVPHHPDTLAQFDALPLDLPDNAVALQQRCCSASSDHPAPAARLRPAASKPVIGQNAFIGVAPV